MIDHIYVNCKCGFRIEAEKMPGGWGPTLWTIIRRHLRRGRWHGPTSNSGEAKGAEGE